MGGFRTFAGTCSGDKVAPITAVRARSGTKWGRAIAVIRRRCSNSPDRQPVGGWRRVRYDRAEGTVPDEARK